MASDKALVKRCAREAGFDLVGVASAAPFAREQAVVLERLAHGMMGQLPWYTEARVRRGCDPQAILPGARSIISVACSYYGQSPAIPSVGSHGRVARYAWYRDYHAVLKKRLKGLAGMLQEGLGKSFAYKLYVDDGPMLDREVARRAGIGFTGKNTNILTRAGSWVLLGQLVTDLELEPDRPLVKSCGSCRACVPACPTGAITSDYVLDSNRCIAYLTIEHRGPIPREMRPLMGDWVFGCDICQDVCPVNLRRAAPAVAPLSPPQNTSLELVELLEMDEEQFVERFAGSPIRRAKLTGMQRNACIALGNLRVAEAVPALTKALGQAPPLVRGHAAWGLGRIGTPEAQRALAEALAVEQDPWVREEIALALGAA
ncbi:MAG: tRNA epoxyqueuosine(34) reductase QueG [Dehalococcoidia bacterium]|nr:tRNA epoxyqueuosine(34) reductase QueG [Dehalococcoidia bacterium]